MDSEFPFGCHVQWFFDRLSKDTGRLTSFERIKDISKKCQKDIFVHFDKEYVYFKFFDKSLDLFQDLSLKSDLEFDNNFIIKYGRDTLEVQRTGILIENLFPKHKGRRINLNDPLESSNMVMTFDEGDNNVDDAVSLSKEENSGLLDRQFSLNNNTVDSEQEVPKTLSLTTHESEEQKKCFPQTYKFSTKSEPARKQINCIEGKPENSCDEKENYVENEMSQSLRKKSLEKPKEESDLITSHQADLPVESAIEADIPLSQQKVVSRNFTEDNENSGKNEKPTQSNTEMQTVPIATLTNVDYDDLLSRTDGETNDKMLEPKEMKFLITGESTVKSTSIRNKFVEKMRAFKGIRKQWKIRKKRLLDFFYERKPNFKNMQNNNEKAIKNERNLSYKTDLPLRSDETRDQICNADETSLTLSASKERTKKYSKDTIKLLRKLTDLLHHERSWQITAFVYPSRKGRFSKSGQRRNQQVRTHSSQAAEGIPDQYPTQVSDGDSENLDLPPAEIVLTSATSIFQSSTNNTPAPTTNLMVSIDAERSLVNRLRGDLPASRFSQPKEPPKHPQYADQPSRQRSFSNWPASTGQDPSRMAVYGFFYTGRFDLIRCFQCGIGLKDWASSDEPLFEHIKHSPDCQFIKDLLGRDLLNAYRDNLLASQLQAATSTSASSGSSTGDPTQASGRVRNPQYSDAQARLRSFDKWPSTSLQTPQALVDAGLFFTGSNDLCRCFTCDGGLQRWDADDDPWIEHARWFPHCTYVRQIKGQEYINMVQQAAAQAREEEQDPAVVYPAPGQHGRTGPVEQGVADSTLQDTNPLNTREAQSVIGMGYSRRAVLLAIHEYNGQAHGERNDYAAGDLVRILTERQDRGEALPPDSPRDSYADFNAQEATQLEQILQLRIGPTYDDKKRRCLKSFKGTRYTSGQKKEKAIQCLYFLNDMVKCHICKNCANQTDRFQHTETCVVLKAMKEVGYSSSSDDDSIPEESADSDESMSLERNDSSEGRLPSDGKSVATISSLKNIGYDIATICGVFQVKGQECFKSVDDFLRCEDETKPLVNTSGIQSIPNSVPDTPSGYATAVDVSQNGSYSILSGQGSNDVILPPTLVSNTRGAMFGDDDVNQSGM